MVALRSLWLDEAMLARNIVDRSLLNLIFTPLDYNQGAPILFLFIEKMSTFILGQNDFALRIFPFICGVLIVPLTIYIAMKLFGKVAGGVAGFLVAFNSTLIFYSDEVKQYSSDAFVALVVTFFFFKWFNEKLTRSHFWKILLLGIITSILSHPSLFIFGGLVFVLWVKTYFQSRKEDQRQDFYRLTGIIFLWILFYGILYVVTLRNLSSNDHLVNYWVDGFMPIPPWSNLQWFRNLPLKFTSPLLHDQNESQIIFLFLIPLGFIFTFRKQKFAAFGIITVCAGLLTASALRLYPIDGRLLIFSIPLTILLISGGGQAIFTLLKNHRILSWTITCCVCLFASYGTINNMTYFVEYPEIRYKEEVKPLMDILEQERAENEALYVYYFSQHAYRYYQTISDREDYLVFYGENHRSEPENYIEEIEKISDFPVIWLMVSHINDKDRATILEYFEQIGTSIEKYSSFGATLWKFQIDEEVN
jgi:hypothetical protein